MGEHEATGELAEERLRAFTRALLDDLRALERMLAAGLFESDVRRIGAEQELFLVDRGGHPAPVAMEVLDRVSNGAFTTELAKFNLEANLPPYAFEGGCLRRMEEDLKALVAQAREAAAASGSDVLLAGILPTLQLADLGLENMTPKPRYHALNEAMTRMRGGAFHVRIKGIDEFYAVHDNVMLESCNTSFQMHFQVAPDEFANLYNLAQAVTGPVLAAAVNSPLLVERRLWHETRVALFQHSIDDRSHAHLARGQRPRVRFGDRWVDRSVLEIFQEDIARFRVVLATERGEDPMAMLDRGEIPPLKALRLHNGTVYRWNRPCFGIHEGRPHLRIENRVLPAGPTLVDEVANAALYFGLLSGMSRVFKDIRTELAFDDVKANFLAAARLGLKAQLTWIGGRCLTAGALIRDELLPLARAGLEAHAVDAADIDRYLGVIEERVTSGRTGAQWALDSMAAMIGKGSRGDRVRALVAASLARQRENAPGHTWGVAQLNDAEDGRPSSRTVGRFMPKDLFTVRPDHLVDLAANLMDCAHIPHVPAADREGHPVCLLSHRTILRHLARTAGTGAPPVAVKEIMKRDPITVTPATPTLDAIEIMKNNRVSCLPVVQEDKLVGIVTERDLLVVAARLFEEQMRSFTER